MKAYVILVTYQVPLEQIMQAAPAHRAYLDQFYQQDIILCSGMRLNRKGGVIITRGESKETIQQLIAGDPFNRQNLATYEIIDFEVRRHQAWLETWLNSITSADGE